MITNCKELRTQVIREVSTPAIPTGPRWRAARSLGGYGAAATLSLYLVVKAVWVVATLLGSGPKNSDMGAVDFVILNLLTVGMACVGIALGLAMVRPWGQRIPAWLFIFAAWVGAGFLVPVFFATVISGAFSLGGPTNGAATESPSSDAMPVWESAFLSIGFAGMAVGLLIALPIYLLERWPTVFLRRVGDTHHAASPAVSPRFGFSVAAAVAVSYSVGLVQLCWAFGATVGLNPAYRDLLDVNARMLLASWGASAILGATSLWVLTARRHFATLPLWIPTAVAFAASGSLFAWSSWRLPMAVWRPGGHGTPEYPLVAAIQHALSISAGIIVLAFLVKTNRHPRPFKSSRAAAGDG